MDMHTGTYQIVCKTTGNKYIGSTHYHRGFEYRWMQHKYKLREGTHQSVHLQRAWNKYGEDDFLFLVLDYAEGRHECLRLEQMYFDTVPRNTLLNCTFRAGGGNGGANLGKKKPPLTEETKRKMSEAHKGKQYTLGKKMPPRSEEHRRKISENKKAWHAARKENK